MNFRDDTKPPLSTEQSDLYWGTNLTETERWLEDLDVPPHRAALEEAQEGNRVCAKRTGTAPVSPRASAQGAHVPPTPTPSSWGRRDTSTHEARP